MFINKSAYINLFEESVTPKSVSGGRKFIASVLLIASVSVVSLQAGFVLNANAENSPISSPISTQESPTPAPSASGNPITSPENPAPAIKLTYPNGGETFNVGDVVRITWEQNGLDQCLFQYVTDNGDTGSNFYPVKASQGYFDWTVEVDNLAKGSSKQIKIDIGCYDSSGHNGAQDKSDNFFTVVNPAAPVSSPEVTPAPSSQPSDSGSSNPGPSNGGGSSNNSAPSCNNEAPKAPKIISAVTTGKNEITLNWEKPISGNVTHYSISYGLMKGKPLYGNPNIGNVTSFTVKGLSAGVNYFFTVKAVNDCTPSEASNEVAVKVGGKFINTLAAVGFKSAVNGVNILGKTVKFQGTNTSVKPVVSGNSLVHITESEGKTISTGLIGKVFNFFKGLF